MPDEEILEAKRYTEQSQREREKNNLLDSLARACNCIQTQDAYLKFYHKKKQAH